ncbi:VOC family protein [Calidithermus roseus]|uniref:Catechol-2,3-dioxygenase n=1 Tax=Calidithermus roseus TaxID=1644118 RepID=A0A399F4N6_9DEIN|nr:VOC family protein [Calidithermus roseus]RIH89581.1 Catechol-2,3-dioxygenase [Calidithermus roseus]
MNPQTPTLALTGLTLRVRDLERQLAFYRDLLGLEITHSEGNRTILSPAGRKFALTLVHEPSAPLRPQPTLGLYHFALLLPERKALARVFRRLLEARYPNFQGASDHGVSEALYLADPEGNGLELYRDRPRGQWPFQGSKLAMVTKRLDLEDLLAEAPPGAQPQAVPIGDRPHGTPLDPETTLGHIHLHVADLDEAEHFFRQFGMEVTQGDYPGARFLAADGYHHHVGINLWARGRTAPAESTGLLEYTLWLEPAKKERLSSLTLTDPNGARVRVG